VLVYLAVIHRIPGCEYRIQFPDFPGVEAHTTQFDRVRDEAKRTLSDEIRKRGGPRALLPRPTSKEDLQLELTYRQGLLLPFEVDESRDPQLASPRGVRAAVPSRRRTANG
jgi:hypothetical protein